MAKLETFWDYIFSRENKVQTFFFRVHWLSELETYQKQAQPALPPRSFTAKGLKNPLKFYH